MFLGMVSSTQGDDPSASPLLMLIPSSAVCKDGGAEDHPQLWSLNCRGHFPARKMLAAHSLQALLCFGTLGKATSPGCCDLQAGFVQEQRLDYEIVDPTELDSLR